NTPSQITDSPNQNVSLQSSFSSPKTQPNNSLVLHDLPPRVLNFVGRKQELQQICALLRQDNSAGNAVVITGMGGVGKSSLAAEVIFLLAKEPQAFPGGFTWLRCDEQRGLLGVIWLYERLMANLQISILPGEISQTSTPEDEILLRERA